MGSRADRLGARAQIAAVKAGRAVCNVLPCGLPAPVQGLDIRVRDAANGNARVAGARITIEDAAGVHPQQVVVTGQRGDVIVFPLPHGIVWNVEGRKEWCLPEPDAHPGVALPNNTLLRVEINLEELRYYLHVDADRDGDIDDRHEGLNVINPWQWGVGNNRGAIILCNNDHDDGLAVAARNPDNEDDDINLGNDNREIAPLQIRRVGSALVPPAASNWQATLEILNGDEDKIRIFDGIAAGDVQFLGANAGGAGVAQQVIPLRTAAPAAYPTTTLGMEAVTYPKHGFDGRVQIKLTISKVPIAAVGNVSYSTGVEVKVAPWMMPNHRDDAALVYVADLGADVANALNPAVLDGGNATFRGNLAAALPGGMPPLNQYVSGDRWMQDCMEIGYSVMPKNAGGVTRHRIEAVMQAFRDFGLDDLKPRPRELLDADYGFHASEGTVAGYDHATAAGLGASNAGNLAFEGVIRKLCEIRVGNLAHVPPIPPVVIPNLTVAQATAIPGGGPIPPAIQNVATDAANAAEAALINGGSVIAAKDAMINDATNAVHVNHVPYQPFENEIARAAADYAAAAASDFPPHPTNTFDSHGNLECTPPCRSTAAAVNGPKEYQWGRIYYGRGLPANGQPFNPETADFLEVQEVQDPIELDSDWLYVGHVDEMMSFIPAPGPEFNQWRLLLASPQRAFHIMDGLPGNTPMLVGRHLHPPGWGAVNSTAGVLRNGVVATPVTHPVTGAAMTGAQLRNFNLTFVQPRIDGVANQLVNDIGLNLAEVIHVPVVFMPEEVMTRAGALTADMVNMLVVNDTCIVPTPFGPIHAVTGNDMFEEDLSQSIQAANPALQVTYVDDWYTYHAKMGEIHCGTNTLRQPANMNAWLQSEAAEWWRFDG